MPLAFALITPSHFLMWVLLVLGFGFVIFWHELGHFLAAKYVGIKVEQFAVGFGQALVSWRKGIGFRFGNTQKDYRDKIEKHLLERRRATPEGDAPEFTDAEISVAADELGLGDTEYRLNWIPLGGYVKMLGQDDLKPDSVADDPKAYNKKSVGARMLVISAGVIMNVILAAIGFMILFLIGFNVQPAWAGNVIPDSPAQKAGVVVGDHFVKDDSTKLTLDVALAKEGAAMPVDVERVDAQGKIYRKTLMITPEHANGEKDVLQIGVSFPYLLQGVKKQDAAPVDKDKLLKLVPDEVFLVEPGETVTAVNGIVVKPEDYVKFHEILQSSFGKPVMLSVRHADGKVDAKSFQPHFQEPFNGPFNLAGMVPRALLDSLNDNSALVDKGKPGDVILSMTDKDPLPNPSRGQMMTRLGADGEKGTGITLLVLRDGKEVRLDEVKPNVSLGHGRKGLGVVLTADEKHSMVAEVLPDTPAAAAGLKGGDQIVQLGDARANTWTNVATWYDMHRILSQLKIKPAGKSVSIDVTYKRGTSEPRQTTMTLNADQLASIADAQYLSRYIQWAEYTRARQTSNPWTAACWGVTETRDFILQFYLTLRRMVGGSISPSNMMGPVGIFYAGGRLAYKGVDWLLWFLAMISANLAVVNFLPIPVVDGGHFMFLIFEKIKGKALSPRSIAIAQYAGLAFLAALVLYVTYQDILRFV